MTCSRRFWILASLFIFLSPTAPAEQKTDGKMITVIADTIVKDRNGGMVRMDFGWQNLDDLENLRVNLENGRSILPAGTKTEGASPSSVTGFFVVPARATAEEVDFYLKSLRQALERRGSTGPINILRVDVPAHIARASANNVKIRDTLELLEENNGRAASGTKLSPKQLQEAAHLAAAMIRANNKVKTVLGRWSEEFSELTRKTKSDPKLKTMLFASTLGIASTAVVVVGGYWMGTIGLNRWGVLQTLVTGLSDQLNTTFAPRIVDIWSNAKIRESQKPVAKFTSNLAVKLFNHFTFVRAVVANAASQIIVGGSARFVSHMYNPERFDSPLSASFFAELWGVAAISGVFSANADVGMRRLVKKGYASERVENITSSVFNLNNQISTLLLNSGSSLLWTSLAIEWTSKAAVGTAGWVLPTKGNRFYFFHPEVSEQSQKSVRYLNDLVNVLQANDVTPEQLRELASRLEYDERNMQRRRTVTEAIKTRYRQFSKQLSRYVRGGCAGIRWLVEGLR